MNVVIEIFFAFLIFVISLILLFAIFVFIAIPKINNKKQNIYKQIDENEIQIEIRYAKKRLYRIVKRIEDIVISTMGLICFSPIMLIITILLILSKQKVLKVKRINGYKGLECKLYQFNINKDSNEILKGFWKMGFEMLPRFYNILKGDMTMVGISTFETVERRQLLEHEKPGMVHLAAIFPFNPTLIEKYDKYYLKNRGFGFDLFVTLGATVVVLRDKE